MWKINPVYPANEAYAWSNDVFTKQELDLIINIGKNIPMRHAGVNDMGIAPPTSRRSKISWIKPSIETEFIFQKLSTAILTLNDNYFKYDLTVLEDLQFSEYDESYKGMYRNHTDDGFAAPDRKLSFSLQLTEPEEYDGGDLLLYRFRLDDPTKVQRQRGLLGIFPSWTIHEVTPVVRGTRYSLVGWVHGPRFK